jgi:hypothetical protein
MGLWGTDADSTANKPKNLTTDTNSDYAKKDVFANNMGWVRRAGTAANGNDNADAQEEVLVAIGDLSGASSTTGLKAPTISSCRFIVGTTANTDFTANDANAQIDVEVTYDEEVTVNTSGGTPTLVIANNDASGGGYGNLTLTYLASESTANSLRFRKTSAGIGNTDVLTIGGSNIVLNSGTITDTADGSTAASLAFGTVGASKTVTS